MDLTEVRELALPDGWNDVADPDHVALLCRETVQEGHGVLIFCATKQVSRATSPCDRALDPVQ